MPFFSMKMIASIDDDAGDDADHGRRPGVDEGTRCRDRHEAGEHAVAIIPGSGFPSSPHDVEHRDGRTERGRDRGVRRRDGEAHVGRRERRRGVEAEPAEQQDEHAEHGHRDVVAGHRARLAVLAVLADARPEHDAHRRAPRHHRPRARRRSRRSRRSRSRAPPSCRAWPASRRPTSTPRTAGSRCAPQNRPQPTNAVPLPPLGHGAGRDRRRRVHERDHVEEERRDRCRLRRGAEVAAAPNRPATGTPSSRCRAARGRPVRRARRSARAEPAEREREPDEEERDEPETEDREVRRHHVRRVLLATEAGLDQREPGLHEHDEDRADDDPEQVEADAVRRDRDAGHVIERSGLPARTPHSQRARPA